jgi:O-antigen/teichoic acid export membrane protein
MSSVATLPRPATGRPPKSRLPRGDSRREHRDIRRGFSWLAAGTIVNSACSWGRIALLARLGNAEMVGQLTLALAVCKPIADFADIGLSGSLISDARREFRIGDYIGLRLMTCVLAALVIAGMAWTGGYDAATARLIALAGVLVVCESLCDIFQAVLQRDERMHWVAVSLILRGVAGLALFAVILWTTHNLAWAVLGFCIATVAALAAIDVPRALDRRVASSAAQTHHRSLVGGSALRLTAPYIRLAWLSLPLGLATTSLTLTTSIPRYWIAARLGTADLGGFAVAGSLMIAISYVVGTLSQAACPRLARYHTAGNRTGFLHLLGWLSLWLAAITIASVAVMLLAGRPIIGLLFGTAFVSYAAVATCLMLAAGLRNFGILLGRAITSMRRFRTALALRLLGIVLLVLLLPGWIDWLGLIGAAWAVTLSWLISTLLSLAVVLRVGWDKIA